MDATRETRRQLGELMVDEGFLTLEQLTYALGEQQRTGRPLGKVLVELGFVSAGAVANALAEQHGGLLKTEFGISAGLHALPDGAPRPVRAAPEPAAPAPDPIAVAPVPASHEPVLVARVQELEAQLHELLAQRNALAENLNELQARLGEAAQAHEADAARAAAAAEARISALEAEVQAGLAALREQAQQQPEQRTAAGETAGQAHLLFVPPASGYALIEFDGPDPPSGTLLDVDDVSFVIRRVGPSPFPESRLRCVFLDRL